MISSREDIEKRVDYLRKNNYYGHVSTDNMMSNLPQEFGSFDYETRTLSMKYEVRDWMLNPSKTMHGGLIGMCADDTCGSLVETFVGVHTPTIELSVSYLRPILQGDDFVITAHAGHIGRTLAHVTAEIRSEANGTLLATCKGVYYTAASKEVKIK